MTPVERRAKVRQAVEALVEMHRSHAKMRRTVLTLMSHKDATDEQILAVAHQYRTTSQDAHARKEQLREIVHKEFPVGQDTYFARSRLERMLDECKFLT